MSSRRMLLGSGASGRPPLRFIMAAHNNSIPEPYILTSENGTAFTTLSGPIGAYVGPNPTLMHWNGYWWLIHNYGTVVTVFSVWRSPTLDFVTDGVKVGEYSSGVAGVTEVWPPRWVRHEDGTVYLDPSDGRPRLICTLDISGSYSFHYMVPTNDALSAWATMTAVTGSWSGSVIDPYPIEKGSNWYLFYRKTSTNTIDYAVASAPGGPYTVVETGDWAGWYGAIGPIECPGLVKLDGGRWRAYMQHDATWPDGVWYSDSVDDWATWTSPVQVTCDFAANSDLAGPDVLYTRQR